MQEDVVNTSKFLLSKLELTESKETIAGAQNTICVLHLTTWRKFES